MNGTLRAGGTRVRGARVPVRTLCVCLGLAAAAFGAAVLVIGTGDLPIPPADVVRTLFGEGTQVHRFIVTELRLPRALTGILVGLALGLSGAVFQSLSRNPLGSPDLIGFTTGAATGALVQILLVGGGTAAVAFSSVGGAALTGTAVYLLAYRGGVHGNRLVLVGVGVAAMLEAFNSYLITRAELREAYEAAFWLTGSLDGRDWDHVKALGVALAVLVPFALALGGRLRMVELGDDVARSLGVRVEQSRGLAVAGGVGLVAVATAAAGPVAFVALAAPQLARRLTRGSGPQLLPSALMGAALLVVSDLVALRLPVRLPVGVVTSVLGGVYLVWLLGIEGRRGR
ncbi:iron chelate uptake ABC transporter family permease subunit [Actinocorallia sp. B10E7]|uniref:FecCD family ABC transporter permease n=1 Tax=Actinocorallia sp. B10E7 TaxID=3153558 RepID=UPI00325D3A82